MGEFLKGYKGFKQGLVCKGKQYKENTVFEENEAVICKSGMHFCVNPFDVLDHYDLVNSEGSFNDFANVEALDKCITNDNRKYCTKKLKIGAKLSFSGFINACIDFVIEKTNYEESDNGSSGYSAKIGSSGDYAKIGSSGDSAKIGSSGYYAKVNSTGMYAVVMCAGYGCIARAKKGSFITLAEWKKDADLNAFIPQNVVTVKVDGEKIKEDTYYKLVDGKFVEAEAGVE